MIGLKPAELAEGLALQYEFNDHEVFKPKLTLRFKDDQPVNAALSASTTDYLKVLIAIREKRNDGTLDTDCNDHTQPHHGPNSVHQLWGSAPLDDAEEISLRERSSMSVNSSDLGNVSQVRSVEIPLRFDAEFFGLLQEDVATLETLRLHEQKALMEQINALSKDMTHLAAPSKFAKTDMYRWRELFDIYQQAQIFFSTREQDRGSRNSAAAARKLCWFQSEVTRRGLLEAFKLPSSCQTFGRFVKINILLLRNLKFQEMNQLAIEKILKSKLHHWYETRESPSTLKNLVI